MMKITHIFIYFQAATSTTTASMIKDAENVIKEEVKLNKEDMEVESCEKLYHLLANLYLHDCVLPKVDGVL